jgi:hypothetical protein
MLEYLEMRMMNYESSCRMNHCQRASLEDLQVSYSGIASLILRTP